MTDHGDDCYFYYYSTCTKGDSCPFRHCEAAMGNETVCSLWKEGGCFRKVCMFRHMEIKKNRKEIACYWEKQPAGCQKPHCAFYHKKPRFIEGVYVPPSKGVAKVEEPPQVEPVTLPTPLPTAANPQLRGVIKAETQETVPSPTHPPVVINPADDDEDEDDQYSEGEDGIRLTSPRKLPGGPNSHEGLNFGVSTLEEIRLRKALKASMKRAGYPVQDADGTPRRSNGAYGEKENLQGFSRSACLIASNADTVACDDADRPRGSLAQRLGKKILNNDVQRGEQLPLHRGLAARLGGVVDEVDAAPLMALRPVRERPGSPHAPAAPGSLAPEARGEARKLPTQKIRIKTLEEIRQEKAAMARIGSSFAHSSSSSKTTSSAPAGPTSQGCPRPPRGSRRTVTVVKAAATTSSIDPSVKTFSKAPPAKRMRKQQAGTEEKQGEEVVGACREKPPGPDEAKQALTTTTTTTAMATPVAEVRVKTLEEIRREKSARVMLRQTQEAQNRRGPAAAADEAAPKKPRLLRVTKPGSPGGAVTQKPAEAAEKPVLKAAEPGPTSSGGVTVKTFEEIMREKRLRRQEQEEQAASSGSQSPASTSAETDSTLKRKAPATEGSVSPGPSAVATPASPAQKAPLVKATLAPSSATASPKKGSSPRLGRGRSSPHGPDDDAATKAGVASPVKVKGKLRPQRVVKGAAASKGPGFSQDAPPAVQAQSNSPAKPPETKVRPKLNVKPSMIRPSERVRPDQKSKAAERSAVAAVKPLNSASSAPEEALQESPCKSRMMFLSSHAETPVAPRSPSPLREELQTDPVFQRSEVPSASSREACALPRSPPAARPPGQARPRRPSAVSAAAVDDFEELMNEFNSGDQLEGDIDSSLGEDDLLQELSEMIDS